MFACEKVLGMNRLIRMKELTGVIGYRPWNIYRLIRQGDFPASVKLGERAVAWRESDVQQWIDDREPQ